MKRERTSRAKAVEYFRSANKYERDRWVVQSFLTNLDVSFGGHELGPGQDPPDVKFRDTNFEIKEILDRGRLRHKEYKQGLEEAIRATSPRDLVRAVQYNELSIQTVYDLILERSNTLTKKYPLAVRENLDLLFYVNLLHTFEFIDSPFPGVTELLTHGWRSVSFIEGYRSGVFVATSAAPSYIRGHVGCLVIRRTKEN